MLTLINLHVYSLPHYCIDLHVSTVSDTGYENFDEPWVILKNHSIMNSKYITVFFVIFYWLSVPPDMNSCWLTEEQGVITTWPASQSNHFMRKNYSRAPSDSAVHCKKGLRYSRPGIGLGTEFHSEKIPRNRLGTVSVIPRHSEFRGRANSVRVPRKSQFWSSDGTEQTGIPRKN